MLVCPDPTSDEGAPVNKVFASPRIRRGGDLKEMPRRVPRIYRPHGLFGPKPEEMRDIGWSSWDGSTRSS